MVHIPSSVDGASIGFVDRGTGVPVLVFIHGLSGDHHDFDDQLASFANRHRVIGMDLPGHGPTRTDRSVWSMDAHGRDVADVVDHLGLADVILIGHSFGGDATVDAAKYLGNRVRGLVWVSSYREFGSPKTESQLAAWLAPFHQNFAAAMDDLTRRNFGPAADPSLVGAKAEAAMLCDPERTIGILSAKFRNEPLLLATLADLDVPVVAINANYKPSNTKSLGAHGVEVRTIDGAGHFVMLEAPERFNAVLDEVISAMTESAED